MKREIFFLKNNKQKAVEKLATGPFLKIQNQAISGSTI